MIYSVDGYAVLLALARPALPGVNVYTRIPDGIPEHVPLFVIRRTGGGIDRRLAGFTERWLISAQIWTAPEYDVFDLAGQISTIFYNAWMNQTVTSAGHIAHCRNGSGWRDVTDPDLTLYARGQASFEFLLRPPASA